MRTIEDYKKHEEFESIRRHVLTLGIDDPFFDEEGFVGGYWLQQNSYEFTAFILFLRELFPDGMDRFVEIGTAAGGFARALFELVGMQSYISIDDGKWRSEKTQENLDHIFAETKLFRGDSHSKECADWLAKELADYQGNTDMFFIDGDHSYEGVKKDIFLGQRLLPTKTLLGFHDIACSRTPGVTKAYGEIKEKLIMGQFIHTVPNKMGIGVLQLL